MRMRRGGLRRRSRRRRSRPCVPNQSLHRPTQRRGSILLDVPPAGSQVQQSSWFSPALNQTSGFLVTKVERNLWMSSFLHRVSWQYRAFACRAEKHRFNQCQFQASHFQSRKMIGESSFSGKGDLLFEQNEDGRGMIEQRSDCFYILPQTPRKSRRTLFKSNSKMLQMSQQCKTI